MADTTSGTRLSTKQLILVPALITLAITILRVVGELQHWSRVLFNPSAGGGGALVGIAWLPLIFGPYFALKLVRASEGPTRTGRAVGYALLGVLGFVAGGALAFAPRLQFPGKILVGLHCGGCRASASALARLRQGVVGLRIRCASSCGHRNVLRHPRRVGDAL